MNKIFAFSVIPPLAGPKKQKSPSRFQREKAVKICGLQREKGRVFADL
jgi:hypothetical protein